MTGTSPQGARIVNEAARIPSLDGLRAVAIFLVVLGHGLTSIPDRPPEIAPVAASDHVGVLLFLTLSRYLITMLLLRERARERRLTLPASIFVVSSESSRQRTPISLFLVSSSIWEPLMSSGASWRWPASTSGTITSGRRNGFSNTSGLSVWRISYSLYIWQQLFLAAKGLNRAWSSSFPFNEVHAVAAAEVSYWLIERPFLLLKDRISSRRASRISTPASASAVWSDDSLVRASGAPGAEDRTRT